MCRASAYFFICQGIHFVYAASSSTYGDHPDLPKVEDKIGNPLSPYAVTKLVNELYGALTDNDKFFATPDGKWVLGEAMKSLSLCLAPFAPHLMEELWYEMGHRNLIASANWPEFRADLLVASQFTLVIQVNGKVRDRIDISKGLSKDEVQKIVMEIVKIKPFIEGKTLKQFIYVKERLANVVVV